MSNFDPNSEWAPMRWVNAPVVVPLHQSMNDPVKVNKINEYANIIKNQTPQSVQKQSKIHEIPITSDPYMKMLSKLPPSMQDAYMNDIMGKAK